MVGGSRRDEGSLVINNTNVFAALDTLRKKKKGDKGSSKNSKGSSKLSKEDPKKDVPPQPELFWKPAPITNKSWADVEDDDDDDYYSSTAPPSSAWGPVPGRDEAFDKPVAEESESEEDILDEGDEDVEDEQDHETEPPVHQLSIVSKPTEVAAASKETEKQLSKKERKKKELAELEALLADFGVAQNTTNGKESEETNVEKKEDENEGEVDKKDNAGESRAGKKKKKKPTKEVQFQTEGVNESEEGAGSEVMEEESSAIDVKEKLKKMASMKKKKSSKEMDAAAKAAAQEAAARRAKLAAAKKKEKTHYNQQPIR